MSWINAFLWPIRSSELWINNGRLNVYSDKSSKLTMLSKCLWLAYQRFDDTMGFEVLFVIRCIVLGHLAQVFLTRIDPEPCACLQVAWARVKQHLLDLQYLRFDEVVSVNQNSHCQVWKVDLTEWFSQCISNYFRGSVGQKMSSTSPDLTAWRRRWYRLLTLCIRAWTRHFCNFDASLIVLTNGSFSLLQVTKVFEQIASWTAWDQE